MSGGTASGRFHNDMYSVRDSFPLERPSRKGGTWCYMRYGGMGYGISNIKYGDMEHDTISIGLEQLPADMHGIFDELRYDMFVYARVHLVSVSVVCGDCGTHDQGIYLPTTVAQSTLSALVRLKDPIVILETRLPRTKRTPCLSIGKYQRGSTSDFFPPESKLRSFPARFLPVHSSFDLINAMVRDERCQMAFREGLRLSSHQITDVLFSLFLLHPRAPSVTCR